MRLRHVLLALVAAGCGTPSSAGGDGTDAGGGGGGTSVPDSCDARAHDCPDGMFCDVWSNECGRGRCQLAEERARWSGNEGWPGEPVCSCGGEPAADADEAARAGFDIAAVGACTPLPGHFQCGHRFCRTGTEYCERFYNDAPGEGSDAISCLPVDEACAGAPGCGCIEFDRGCYQCFVTDGNVELRGGCV